MTEPAGNDRVENDSGDKRHEGVTPVEGDLVGSGGISDAVEVIREIAEVERQRAEQQESRNRIALRALEVSENSDRRQFEFHKEKLATEERAREKSHSLAWTILRFGGGVILLLIVLVIVMAFFGNEDQSRIAMEMIEVAGKAAGGAGFVYLVAVGVRRLVRS